MRYGQVDLSSLRLDWVIVFLIIPEHLQRKSDEPVGCFR